MQEGKENRTEGVQFHVPPVDISDQLVRANERLLQLRQQKQTVTGSGLLAGKQWSQFSADLVSQLNQPQPQSQSLQPVTAIDPITKPLSFLSAGFVPQPAEPLTPPESPTTIKLYPSVGNAMLKKKRTTGGRVWLLLHYLDTNRRGWLECKSAEKQITDPDSPFHLFSSRRWRAVLKEGEGLFWERDSHGRIWLAGVERVARRLEVPYFSGNPVAFPLNKLVGGLREFNAHLYAAFHAGRPNSPISRQTLYGITGVPERTQRMYGQIARVRYIENYAVGRLLDSVSEMELEAFWFFHSWDGFILTDHMGKHGKAGKRYLAWRLPNSYESDLARAPRGRQKKMNRSFNEQSDLVTKRARGNVSLKKQRIFCLSAKELSGSDLNDRFWRSVHKGWWYAWETKREGNPIIRRIHKL